MQSTEENTNEADRPIRSVSEGSAGAASSGDEATSPLKDHGGTVHASPETGPRKRRPSLDSCESKEEIEPREAYTGEAGNSLKAEESNPGGTPVEPFVLAKDLQRTIYFINIALK